MHTISKEKFEKLAKLSTKNHVISALAIDQRGSIRKMIEAGGGVDNLQEAVENFKVSVSEELTPFASSILLDPEYGIPASKARHEEAGLLLAYEETGYDATQPGRFPDLLPEWSAKRIKEIGADAVKFLLYYDIDEDASINDRKHAFVERIGSECLAEDIPFFLEIVSYDATMADEKSREYAAVKPHKVNDAMKEFSKERYNVDVLKVEVPVNMAFVEGFGTEEPVYTKAEAAAYFKAQDDMTHLPYIYLSAGVSSEMFQETLKFAHEAGTQFNGVLCGRATWKNAIPAFVNGGVKETQTWLQSEGKSNITSLNDVLEVTAVPWDNKITVK